MFRNGTLGGVDMRKRGTISAFSRKRNFLLIKPDGEDRSVFCHHSDLDTNEDNLITGTEVEFHLKRNDSYEATKVRVVN